MTAFVTRGNMETSLPQRVERREVDRSHRGITDLRERVCNLSWNADRDGCFVHFREGYRRCQSSGEAEPDHTEWSSLLSRYPISDDERPWIGRYERSLNQMLAERPDVRVRLATRGLERSSHCTRSRSASPLALRNVHQPRFR